MSKSLIQLYNESTQAVTAGDVISFGSVLRRYGCNLRLSGGAVEADGQGYYEANVITFDKENTTLGVYQITVDKADDGVCCLGLRRECVAKPYLDVFVIAKPPRNGEDHREDGDKS